MGLRFAASWELKFYACSHIGDTGKLIFDDSSANAAITAASGTLRSWDGAKQVEDEEGDEITGAFRTIVARYIRVEYKGAKRGRN